MSIRPTNIWEDRTLSFEYQKGYPLDWVPINGVSVKQSGYSITATTQPSISAQGQTITLKFSGYYPEVQVSATAGGTTLVSQNLESGKTSLNMTLPTYNSWGNTESNERIVTFTAKDVNNTSVTRTLATLKQSGYYISPEYYSLPVVQGGSTDIQYTFKGDFPSTLTATSSNESVADAYIGQNGTTSITVNVTVYPNLGAYRVVYIYLKSPDGEIRATWEISQQGQEGGSIGGRDWRLFGPINDCTFPNIPSGYKIETNPTDKLAIADVEKIFQMEGKTLGTGTYYFATAAIGYSFDTHSYARIVNSRWEPVIENSSLCENLGYYVLAYKEN
jgi:hypothetical protein